MRRLTSSHGHGDRLSLPKHRGRPNRDSQAQLLRYHGCVLCIGIVVITCVVIPLMNRWDSTSEVPSSSRLVGELRTPGDDSVKLLLASHGRLMWYDVVRNSLDILDEGHGIYYGGFYGSDNPTAQTSLWFVSRPHNWKPVTAEESLMEIKGRQVMRSIRIDSKFTHDVVRKGRFVYVADTERGGILELELPDMKQRRRFDLFTHKEHVNTLSPTKDGTFLWAMLHNLGPSILAKIDLTTGTVVRRIPNVGIKSHGAVQLDEDYILFLDSDRASLARINLATEDIETLFSVEGDVFLKGLCVVDGVAFFGIAASQKRQNRADVSLSCELAAFDLEEKRLLFRRKLPTKGLLNVISAPHLIPESTTLAVTSTPPGSYRTALLSLDDTMTKGKEKSYLHLPPDDPLSQYPPSIDALHWDSGYPRLNNSRKNSRVGFDGGVQMILYHEDVSELKKAVTSLPLHYWEPEYQKTDNAYITGRDNQLAQFKPGTRSIHLIFSDRDAQNVFEFPWYREKFGHLVTPLLKKLLGSDYECISRVQFALMPAHSEIKPHVDSGGYSQEGHRIHFVIASSPDVSFHVCEKDKCVKIHTEEGTVFELNNRLKHYVKNDGQEARIHMVVDVAEGPRQRQPLHVGQICDYLRGEVTCHP